MIMKRMNSQVRDQVLHQVWDQVGFGVLIRVVTEAGIEP